MEFIWRLVFLLALAACSTGKLVTFSNVQPRRTSNGTIMNAHDGTTQRFGSTFYYHAMGYPTCNETGEINGCTNCIFSQINSINVWASNDLSSGSWVLQQAVYPGSGGFPACTYFRSQAVYNAATKLYILWVNVAGCAPHVCPNNVCGAYATATATAPGGPYKFYGMTQPNAGTLGNKSGFIGDFALLADEDGTAYIILTHGTNGAGPRDMYIFELTADFLGFTNKSTGILPGPKLVEAPSFFRRGTTYYALLGGCTCMGLYGGGVAVLTAPHPLGPWNTISATIDPGCPMMKQSDCFQMGPGNVCNPVTQAQQNYVIAIPLVGGQTAFVWTGDKWQQSPDHKYDQQPQTWLPLSFIGDTLQSLQYVDEFTLDVDVE